MKMSMMRMSMMMRTMMKSSIEKKFLRANGIHFTIGL